MILHHKYTNYNDYEWLTAMTYADADEGVLTNHHAWSIWFGMAE